MEEMREPYEELEMEIIEFEDEDVIVTSNPGETDWKDITP